MTKLVTKIFIFRLQDNIMLSFSSFVALEHLQDFIYYACRLKTSLVVSNSKFSIFSVCANWDDLNIFFTLNSTTRAPCISYIPRNISEIPLTPLAPCIPYIPRNISEIPLYSMPMSELMARVMTHI